MEIDNILESIDNKLSDLKLIKSVNASQLADKTYLVKMFLEMLDTSVSEVKKYYETLRTELCNTMLREDTGKLDKNMFTVKVETKSRWSPLVDYKGDVLDYFKNNENYKDLWTITSTDLNKTLTDIANSDCVPVELNGKIKEYIEQHVRITAKKLK